eukprot:CAMPEP_0119378930 /NCGR_PEP_ID=MMETSP1334-20130426/50556_1 /TAXON_ID=127549 /ORGANISM="Calcidiscus leptoporus, Strain RCC1130" /LENGTH=137 /DNA_ID=CAMNT_0007398295 /DNA_START=143 /DNA_END=557 /DNA_ORIENTATION=-
MAIQETFLWVWQPARFANSQMSLHRPHRLRSTRPRLDHLLTKLRAPRAEQCAPPHVPPHGTCPLAAILVEATHATARAHRPAAERRVRSERLQEGLALDQALEAGRHRAIGSAAKVRLNLSTVANTERRQHLSADAT